MRITGRQIRQIIREELSRLQETEWGDDPDALAYYSGEDAEEEGTGYEYLRHKPKTIDWTDGDVNEDWLSNHLSYYKKHFPSSMWSDLARDFEVMLSGEPWDPDVVENYRNSDGTSVVTRQTVEALVNALHAGQRRA